MPTLRTHSTLLSGGTGVTSVDGLTGDVVLATSYIPAAALAAPGGVATLTTPGGKLLSSQLPPIPLGATWVVANQAARLALAAAVGDFCVQTDLDETFRLTALPASTNGNWVNIPGGTVASVDGRVGAVTLADEYDAAGAAAAVLTSARAAAAAAAIALGS